jgi:methionyl-tRNA formyltransferase
MRLLLLLGPGLDWYFAEALERLAESPEIEIVGALVEVRSAGFRFRALRREFAKGRGGFVLVMAGANLHRALAHQSVSSMSYMEARGLPAWPVKNLYAPESVELMRSLEPDLIFRSGFGIIREPVLSLAPRGVLSYHHGNIRTYRGQPVAFWELHKGEREMGVTLQILAEELDAGTVVAERTVPVHRTDTWRRLERRAYETGVEMLLQACVAISHDTLEPLTVPESELGELHTLPNLRQWSALQAKVLARRLAAPANRRPSRQ